MHRVVTHEYVHRCLGQWVICHTRYGDYHGRLEAFDGQHVVLYSPIRRRTGFSMITHKAGTDSSFATGTSAPDFSPAYFPGFGFGRVAIPLAAIFGLTLIGASALWW